MRYVCSNTLCGESRRVDMTKTKITNITKFALMSSLLNGTPGPNGSVVVKLERESGASGPCNCWNVRLSHPDGTFSTYFVRTID